VPISRKDKHLDKGLGKASGIEVQSVSAASPKLPVVVAQWDRNARQVVRVTVDHYKGCDTIDLRGWYHDPKGGFKPTPSGLTLAIWHLPALIDALTKALDVANELGLQTERGEP
jgi:hypothetical protein